MKQLFLIWTFILASFSIHAADITPITNAFKGGNASSISSFMDVEVDIALPESAGKCNIQDAVSMLNAFFQKNKPTNFTVLHHADKKDNGFFVGKLTHASGEFRVNITYKANDNKAIIRSIRIE